MAIPGLEVTERPWAGAADARAFAQDPGPGNPNVPPGGSKQARGLRSAAPVAPAAPVAGTPAPNRLRAAYDGFTGRNFVGPNPQLSAGTRAARMLGPAVAVATEVPGIARVAQDPNSSGIDVATQVAGASGKLAAAGLGAKAGAALGSLAGPIGTAAGGVIGGAAGYFGADSAIKAGRSAVGTEVADPADRVAAAPAADTPSLRVRPEDTMAGPPVSAMQPAVLPTPQPVSSPLPGGVTRVGNEYSGMNVRGDISVNGQPPGGGAISAQNMAAADALAGRETLRSMVAAGVPATVAPTVRHSGNDWQARNDLRNLEVGASSITNRPEWQSGSTTQAWSTRGGNGMPDPQGKVAAYQAALKQDIGLRGAQSGVDLEMAKSNNSLRGQQVASAASMYGSDNSLRGTMYSADSQLGAKRMEMERSLRQQQLVGEAFRRSGGDPVATAKALAGAGLTEPAKSFQDMAASDQTRTQNNVKDARSTFENMFTRDGEKGPERDENAEALANNLAAKIVPGWENMSAEQRAANRTKVVDATRMVQGMNSLRNNSWTQKIGLDAPTPAYSQLPDLNGATVTDVGLWEGLTTPDVRSGDKKISLRDGGVRYLPQGQLSESQLRILQDNGAKRQ